MRISDWSSDVCSSDLHVSRTPLSSPASHRAAPLSVDAGAIRAALRNRRKLFFHYCNAEGRASERTVRPLALAFYGPVWLLIAWCELRADFRAFRLDRMRDMTVLEARFAEERGKTLHDFVLADRARRAEAHRKEGDCGKEDGERAAALPALVGN